MTAHEGDLFVHQSKEGWHVLKILRIGPFGDGEPTAHVLTYEALAERPSLVSLSDARILIRHAPIALAGATQEAELLGNLPVTAEELAGYHEYLKLTDFPAYLQETGKSRSDILPFANAAYLEGNRLCNEKKFEEALAAYDQALDHFPFFIEAIDNRALTLMDLGRLQEAVTGFEQALRIQPDNPVALFSIGECYLKLSMHAEAVAVFKECVARWPDKEHNHRYLRIAESLMAAASPPKKPWWKKW